MLLIQVFHSDHKTSNTKFIHMGFLGTCLVYFGDGLFWHFAQMYDRIQFSQFLCKYPTQNVNSLISRIFSVMPFFFTFPEWNCLKNRKNAKSMVFWSSLSPVLMFWKLLSPSKGTMEALKWSLVTELNTLTTELPAKEVSDWITEWPNHWMTGSLSDWATVWLYEWMQHLEY